MRITGYCTPGIKLDHRLPVICFALLFGVASGIPATASAIDLGDCENTAGYECEYHIDEKPIQKVPSFFKFQSRISQAKLPVGDAVFSNIIVNVKHRCMGSGTAT